MGGHQTMRLGSGSTADVGFLKMQIIVAPPNWYSGNVVGGFH